MTDDRIKGVAREGLGHLQDGIGGLTGDMDTQAQGKLNQVAGSAQNAYGKVRDGLQDATVQIRDQAQDVFDDVEGYLRDKPLVAVGVSFGVGLALGLLLAGRSKTIYLSR